MIKLLPIGLTLALGCATTPVRGEIERGFVVKTVTLDGRTYNYQVFVPEHWSPLEEWPVILFLHGAGERGTDNTKQVEVGIGPAIRRTPDTFPAIVVMPQCHRGVWWNDPAMEKLALTSLDRTVGEYNGDPQRLYLTGLSMGGYGTFYFGAHYPNKFAALAPICGGVVPPRRRESFDPPGGNPYAEVARKIGRTPIWIFHGGSDPVVPVDESRRMVEELKKIGNPVKYTEYPEAGHNSWDQAYAEPSIFTWLLSHRRSSSR